MNRANFTSHLKHLLPSLGIAITFVLGASTIIGGLFAWGELVGVAILAAGVLIVAVGSVARRDARMPIGLEVCGFAYPEPDWLGAEHEAKIKLHEALRASIVLLAYDRSDSGFWGTTYLYRRAVTQSGLPVAKGSLTGTPLALLAIGSCLGADLAAFRRWAYAPLASTIAGILSTDGNYVLEYRAGTALDRVPIFEPLRHAAGGLLATMLFGQVTARDLETLRLLALAAHENVGWTKGAIFRTLLHASYLRDVPRRLRRMARRRSIGIFRDLVASGEASVSTNQIWADPYDYGTQIKNQWMTLWTVLPALATPDLPRRQRSSLEILVRRFLRGQDTAVPLDSLLPSSFDANGRGVGAHVFGTAVAVAAARALAVHGTTPDSNDDYLARRALQRLTSGASSLLELPTEHAEGKPTELEGYFAWAGICLAAATLGLRLSVTEFRQGVELATDLRGLELVSGPSLSPTASTRDLEACKKVILETAMFQPSTAKALAASVLRLSGYARIVVESAAG